MFEEGLDQDLDDISHARLAADPDSAVRFEAPTDVDRERAKKAFDVVKKQISKRDLNSDNLFEDMISEKAYKLDRVSKFQISPFA